MPLQLPTALDWSGRTRQVSVLDACGLHTDMSSPVDWHARNG